MSSMALFCRHQARQGHSGLLSGRKTLMLLFTFGQLIILLCIYRELNGNVSRVGKLSVGEQQQEDGRIPRIVHQTWKTRRIPSKTVQWVRKWRETNPNWSYLFWTDKMARDFIARKFPKYLKLYDEYSTNIHRVDIFRYFLLYHYGGLYADLDIEPLKSLEPILNWSSPCVLPLEPDEHYRLLFPHYGTKANNFSLTSNAIMFCRPRHPFFLYVIEHLQLIKDRKDCDNPLLTLECTGPMMLSVLRISYLSQLKEKERGITMRTNVATAPARFFVPTFNPAQADNIRAICEKAEVKPGIRLLPKKGMELCDWLKESGFQNVPHADSFTVHHWMHSWNTRRKGPWTPSNRKEEDIRTVVQDVIFGDALLNKAEVYRYTN